MSEPGGRLKHFLGCFTGGNACIVCNSELVEGQRMICPACLAELPRTYLHRIPSNPLSEIIANAVAPPFITGAWFYYDRDHARANIIRLSKYHDRPKYLRTAGKLYGMELKAEIGPSLAEIDVLLPIPMHASKEFRRGFNQAREVALGLSEATGIPVGDNLYMRRAKDTQTHRNTAERKENVRNVFGVDHPEELEGLNVMLVDDVITTGATMTEAALTLGIWGARPASISIVAIGYRNCQ